MCNVELNVKEGLIVLCSRAEDPFNQDLRRWSPRRNMAVAFFQSRIYLMGGHAVGDDFEVTTDSKTILKNDVWSSTDGATWILTTPGCRFEDPRWHSGVENADCLSSNDCFGDSYCVNQISGNPVAAGSRGRCRCNVWSARERHSVAVYNNELYLSGGIEHVPLSYCGELPCGGGYHRVASDLWSSINGEHWTKLSASRQQLADHRLIVHQGQLVAMTSATIFPFNVVQNASSEPVLEDEATGGLAVWRGRFFHILDADAVFEYDMVDDKWERKVSTYTWAEAPVASLLEGITQLQLEQLNAEGIFTVEQLATATAEAIVRLREEREFFNVCYYRKRAEGIVNKCSRPDRISHGHFQKMERAVILPKEDRNPYLRGTLAVSVVNLQEEDVGKYGLDGCQNPGFIEDRRAELEDVPKWQFDADRGYIPDAVCQWIFPSRTHLRAESFKDRLYVISGRYSQDVWYMDETIPETYIDVRPVSGSSESIFEFSCNEEVCLFEYTIYLQGSPENTIREWTRSNGTLNYLSWLKGGEYTLEVRALDPAGNVDTLFEAGRNIHSWKYIPKLPPGLFLGIFSVFVTIVLGVYLEIRRRRKKAALERYALKRMRRKFKGIEKKQRESTKSRKKRDKKGGTSKGHSKHKHKDHGGKSKHKHKDGAGKSKTKHKHKHKRKHKQ